jgi:hypothetical protein
MTNGILKILFLGGGGEVDSGTWGLEFGSVTVPFGSGSCWRGLLIRAFCWRWSGLSPPDPEAPCCRGGRGQGVGVTVAGRGPRPPG